MKRHKKGGPVDKSDRIFTAVCYLFVIVFTIMCFYPFWYIMVYSVSDATLAKTGIYLWPKGFSLETYKQLFKRGDIIPAYGVSALRTVLGTMLTILCTTIYAFLLTRKEMIGRKIVYRYTIMTMYVGAGIIPWYLTMKIYQLNESFLLYILPGAISAYYMILIKTYMEQLPESLEESAQLEGAGFFDILFRIIMPLCKPILATVAVFCAVGQWNSWSDNFFLVRNSKLQTLQLILRNYLTSADKIAQAVANGQTLSEEELGNAVTAQSIQMVAIMVVTLPIMLVYPFAQKYFTKGIMMGAIKG